MATTSKSDLAARAAAVIPGGVNSGQRRVPGLEELVIAATSGSTFTDGEGNTYTDYHAAFGPPLLGHGDPDVDAAVAATARTVGLMGIGVTEVEVELAERIWELVPSVERVLLTETGSEATFHALRVARAATGRRHVIKFQGCYHGWHDSVAMNVISLPENVGKKDPLSKGVLQEVIDATIVCRFNDADDVERALSEHDVAAIILEPIPHNIGCVLPKPGFLERLRELCDKHGTVLIFDEVITGWRHALGGYQSIAGVTPDLTAMGKAMGNGWPVSALGGKAELMELFSTTPGRPAFFAGTFNGHPPTSAAALATIDKLQREPVHEHVFALGRRTRQGLRRLYARLGVPVCVSGFGSVFVTALSRGRAGVPRRPARERRRDVHRLPPRADEARHLQAATRARKRNHFSYAHTDEDVDRLSRQRRPQSRLCSARVEHAGPLHDRSHRGGQAGRPAPATANLEHRRLGEQFRPDRVDRKRLRADRARAGRQSRRRVRRPGCRAASDPGARTRAGERARDRHPRPLDRRLEGVHAPLAVRRELQPLVSGQAGRRAERTARGLPHTFPDPAVRRRHRHPLRRPDGVVPPLLAHARRRRSRAASRDARGHAGVELRPPISSHRSTAPACCRSRRKTRGRS